VASELIPTAMTVAHIKRITAPLSRSRSYGTLIRRRLLDVVNHEDFNGSFRRLQFQPNPPKTDLRVKSTSNR